MEFKLRKIKEEDAESIAENANNEKIAKNLTDGFPFPYSLKDAEEYVKFTIEDSKSLHLGIEVEGKIVGMISVAGKKDYAKTIGYWLGESCWGKGIMTQAAKLIIKEAFKDAELQRIEGRVYSHNLGSARILEKLGFKKEGILRKASKIYDGTLVNEEWVFGLLREDWDN